MSGGRSAGTGSPGPDEADPSFPKGNNMEAVVLGVSALPPVAVGAALAHTLYHWCRQKLYERAARRMWYRQPSMSDWGW